MRMPPSVFPSLIPAAIESALEICPVRNVPNPSRRPAESRIERVGVLFVLADIEAHRFGLRIHPQANDRVGYFQQNQAAEKGKADTGSHRNRLHDQLPWIPVE